MQLIDPSQWPTIQEDQATKASAAFKTMGESTKKDMDELNTEWKKLKGVYHAPEEDRVVTLQDPAATAAGELKDKFVKASGYIDTYATDLKGIRGRLDAMREEAENFRKEALAGYDVFDADAAMANGMMSQGGVYVPESAQLSTTKHVSWEHHQPAVDKNNDLVGRLNQILADLSSTESGTAEKINQLVDWKRLEAKRGQCLDRGSFPAYTADQLDHMDAPWGSRGDRVPDGALDHIGTAVVKWGENTWDGAKTLAGFQSGHFSFTDMKHAWGEVDDAFSGLTWLMTTGLYKAARYQLGDKHAYDDVSEEQAEKNDKGGRMLFGFFGLDYDKAAETGKVSDIFDKWTSDPWGTGTTTVLNVGSLFVGPELAAGKVAGIAGKLGVASKAAALAERMPVLGDLAGLATRGGAKVIQWGKESAASSALATAMRLGPDTDSLFSKLVKDIPHVEAPFKPGSGTQTVELTTKAADPARYVDVRTTTTPKPTSPTHIQAPTGTVEFPKGSPGIWSEPVRGTAGRGIHAEDLSQPVLKELYPNLERLKTNHPNWDFVSDPAGSPKLITTKSMDPELPSYLTSAGDVNANRVASQLEQWASEAEAKAPKGPVSVETTNGKLYRLGPGTKVELNVVIPDVPLSPGVIDAINDVIAKHPGIDFSVVKVAR